MTCSPKTGPRKMYSPETLTRPRKLDQWKLEDFVFAWLFAPISRQFLTYCSSTECLQQLARSFGMFVLKTGGRLIKHARCYSLLAAGGRRSCLWTRSWPLGTSSSRESVPEMLMATGPVTHPKDEWVGLLNIPEEFFVFPGSDGKG